MKSSVYISSEKITVIGFEKKGRGAAVRAYAECPLPEETMINGKITDPAQLAACLTELKKNNAALFTEPSLTVDGSNILTKRVNAPQLNKWQYLQLVRDEFADTAEADALICDYQLLETASDNKPGVILACAVEKSQVNSYVETFREAGINLISIRLGVQSLINYVDTRLKTAERPLVFNVVDGFSVLSMIFVNGVNTFLSRTRLYGETREQLVTNILDNLSGLNQFNKSAKFEDLAYSYYLGLSDGDMELMNSLNPYPDISLLKGDIFQNADGAAFLPEYAAFPYLHILLNEKHIDLLRSVKMINRLEEKKKPKKLWVPAIAGVVALIAVTIAALIFLTSGLDNKISEINEYLESADVTERLENIAILENEIAVLNDIINQANGITDLLEAKTPLTVDALNLIINTSPNVSVSGLNFTEDGGTVRLSGSVPALDDLVRYVENLKLYKIVDDVTYRGYDADREGVYSFTIDVYLAYGGESQ